MTTDIFTGDPRIIGFNSRKSDSPASPVVQLGRVAFAPYSHLYRPLTAKPNIDIDVNV